MSEQPRASEQEELRAFLGQEVVLDTRGEILFIGTLEKVGDWFLELSGADVHDRVDSRTSKELYLIESARQGIRKNRQQVFVRKSEVVSISLLAQVILY